MRIVTRTADRAVVEREQVVGEPRRDLLEQEVALVLDDAEHDADEGAVVDRVGEIVGAARRAETSVSRSKSISNGCGRSCSSRHTPMIPSALIPLTSIWSATMSRSGVLGVSRAARRGQRAIGRPDRAVAR